MNTYDEIMKAYLETMTQSAKRMLKMYKKTFYWM